MRRKLSSFYLFERERENKFFLCEDIKNDVMGHVGIMLKVHLKPDKSNNNSNFLFQHVQDKTENKSFNRSDGRITSRSSNERLTSLPTNLQTDIWVHREVTFPK